MSFKKLFLLFGMVVIASCSPDIDPEFAKKDPIDRYGELTRDDFKKQLTPRLGKKETKIETKTPPLPKIDDVMLKPKTPKLGINKVVSISVTDDVPLVDVLIELARLADIDIEIDPSIEGGIILKAKNKPFAEVIDRIADLAQLRYTVKGGILRVERDTPYVVNYPATFLNIVRSNSGNVDISTQVLSGSGGGGDDGGGGGGGGLTSGSSSSISSSYDGDLWTAIEGGITAMIGGDEGGGFVSINRPAGLITVNATQSQHKSVFGYLNKVKDYTSAQVLIEAKVVEVSLDDQFRSGINWSFLDLLDDNLNIQTAITGAVNPAAGGNLTTINFANGSSDITSAVELAQVFGATRTLSSPRIMAMNNQQAVLTFATNRVFFTLDITTDVDASDTSNVVSTEVESTLNTIPIGIILNLQPVIDRSRNEIVMNIRPTLSRLFGDGVRDPGVDLVQSQAEIPVADRVSSIVPEVEVREMDSVLRLSSGEIMVIGGHVEERMESTDSGLPYASEIPIIGNAFKAVDKRTNAVQTIIFLKATIVPSYGVDQVDQDFYKKFTNDPHPYNF